MPATDFGRFEKRLADLAAKFGHEFKPGTRSSCPEAQLRQDYLDPLWDALGWDRENKARLTQSQREVEIESRTDIEGRAKRADYLFRTDARDRFVCEAKKPRLPLGRRDAFQAKRYAFNMGLPLAVLSDFEEIKVYVVGGRPQPDRPDEGHWKTWHVNMFPLVAGEIWDLLARERIAAGSIDALLDSLPRRAPTGRGARARQTYLIKPDRARALDTDFLNFLDDARHDLASSLRRHNPGSGLLAGDGLNAATQHILDRLLFIRICEDRDIDTGRRLDSIVDIWRNQFNRPGSLPARQASFLADPAADAPRLLPADSLWSAVVAHFRALDHRPPGNVPFFNGQLFKHHFSEDLLVGDRWLADFIARLSDDESPYLFNIIPVEILGSVYERFLGKVIRPHGTGVRTEEKPAVRKAGGVYYTPRYIVDYIVEQTVGQLAGGITAAAPKFAAVEKKSRAVRILDPACGSGSFLIRAFERMCEHWLAWFTAHPEDRKKSLCWVEEKTGDVHLTVDLKRQILRDNVFGVDLDPQAVEVTQLSLYLKMLEGETRQSLARERELFGKAIALLPPLDANIKCGNSLIASDFSLVAEDLIRVRAFDWSVQFREIMKAGGFDAVIGNPPYILLQGEFRDDAQSIYFRENYVGAAYKLDTYLLFIEKGVKLSQNGGRVSLITPSNFLTNNHVDDLRRFILQYSQPEQIVVVEGGVFAGVSVDNAIFVLRTGAPAVDNFPIVRVAAIDEKLQVQDTEQITPARVLAEQRALFTSGIESPHSALWDRLSAKFLSLTDLADVNFGKQLRDRAKHTQDVINVENREIIPNTHVACVTGRDVNPWMLTWSGLACLNDTVAQSGGCWDETKHTNKGKLLTRQIGRYPAFAVDSEGYHCLNTIFMITVRDTNQLSPKLLLGILNSKLIRNLWTGRFYDQRQTFPKIKGTYLKQLPIAFLPNTKKAIHNHLVALADKMLTLTPKLRAASKDSSEYKVLQNAVTATDQQIDALVYQLYDLSPEEIALVEAAAP